MKDLRLELKIKNNVLYRAITAKHPSVAAFCRAHKGKLAPGDYGTICSLLRFKTSPFQKTKREKESAEYRSACLRVEIILRLPAEVLFPRYLYERITESERVVEVSSLQLLPAAQREIKALMAPTEDEPEQRAMKGELEERLGRALLTLSYRQKEVLKMRFGLFGGSPHTYDECAAVFKVTREWVRQIEKRALRLLSRPTQSRDLASFVLPDQ